MIAYLKGTIKYQAANWIILDVGGVGYKIFINSKSQITNNKQIPNSNDQNPKSDQKNKLTNPPATLSRSDSGHGQQINQSTEFYIYHHIREDADDLYGLESPEELQMFELLVSVSGVGPKMAMNILSTYNTGKITQIIINSDASSLTAVSGVGKKLSMKMILDLKGKLDSGAISSFSDFDNSSQDLFDALETLGYKKYEVTPFLSKIPQELNSVEDKVKWILKNSKT